MCNLTSYQAGLEPLVGPIIWLQPLPIATHAIGLSSSASVGMPTMPVTLCLCHPLPPVALLSAATAMSPIILCLCHPSPFHRQPLLCPPITFCLLLPSASTAYHHCYACGACCPLPVVPIPIALYLCCIGPTRPGLPNPAKIELALGRAFPTGSPRQAQNLPSQTDPKLMSRQNASLKRKKLTI